MKLLIIGDVAGAASVDAVSNRRSEDTHIVLFKSSATEQAYLLDVRTPQEFASGNNPGAVNIPVDDLRSRLDELPNDRPIAVYCQVGQRGYLATRILLQKGLSVSNIGGGYKTYKLFQPFTK